jgi:NitT/TauT family transport system substrate-binding protein
MPVSKLVAVAACALLLALGTPRPAVADDSLSIVAGAPTPGIFDLLEVVAAGAGFYADEHLNITKNYSPGASAAAQLVATGKADVCVISVEPVLEGYEKGVRLQFFLSRQKRYSYVLAVLNDSPIRTLTDFKGAVIGEAITASPSEVSTQSMLAGAGLGKSDYSFAPIGYGAQGLEAVLNKRVAGLTDIYTGLTLEEVASNVSFRLFRNPILKDIANVGYAALPATIQAKSDVLQRFSRAIVMASLFVRADPQAAARLYLKGSGETITPENLQKTTRVLTLLEDELPAADPSSRRIGFLSGRGLELYSRYLVDYGFAHQVVPAAAIVTDRFIALANAVDRKAVAARAHAMH